MAKPAADTPLDLIIRFSTSQSDITLPLSSPSTTTALTLKQSIRANLPEPASASRLRLIHSGKVLADTAALSKSLTAIQPPPGREDGATKSEKAKGKQPVRESDSDFIPRPRVYIHCSIASALTPAELATEAKSALEADAALVHNTQTQHTTAPGTDEEASTTTPAPRGFDRLLTAGFTPAEITALRAQFLALQSHTHTPDTMPTGPALLALEEAWLDNTSGSNSGGAGADGINAGGFGAEDSGGLDDLLWGNLTGFFWPVGAMFWLMREEGVWTRRRQMAVLSGFVMNLAFGSMRWFLG